MSPLSAHHRKELAASAILPEVAEERGYRSVRGAELPNLFVGSQRREGLLIPKHGTAGEQTGYQLKPDQPRSIDGKVVKYENAKGSVITLDVPPRSLHYVHSATEPLWVTEGVKKSDSAVSNGIRAIVTLQGVHCWSRHGQPLPDWERVPLFGRDVVIAFDSDLVLKQTVRGALDGLARWLRENGAHVCFLLLPEISGLSKTGLDDWFAGGHDLTELQDHVVETLPGEEPWGPAQPLDPSHGPPFPIEVLAPDHRAYVEAVARSTQTPVDLAAWSTLATVGAALRGRYVVSPKSDWHEPVHVQCVQVLPPGTGKSPVYREVMRPISAIESRWHEDWRVVHEAWESSLHTLEMHEKRARKAVLKETSGEAEELAFAAAAIEVTHHRRMEPVSRRLTADDATAQALWSVMASQGGAIAVMSPEGGFLANVTGRYSDAPIFDPILKGHAADAHVLDRKTNNESVRIPRAILAMSIAVQPVVLTAMGKVPGFQSMGVSARLMVSIPRPVRPTELDAPPPEDRLRDRWHRTVERIALDPTGSASEPVSLRLSADARDSFVQVRRELLQMRDSGAFEGFPEWGAKADGSVLRIAGLLHVIEHAEPHGVAIAADSIDRAFTVIQNALEHARIAHRILGGAESSDDAAIVLEKIRELGPEVKRSDLNQSLRNQARFARASSLDGPLKTLVEKGWIRRDTRSPSNESGKTGGRPFEVIRLAAEQPANHRSGADQEL